MKQHPILRLLLLALFLALAFAPFLFPGTKSVATASLAMPACR